MTLKLLPGIVWALDEPALEMARRWRDSLPQRAKEVFNVANSWEEFTQILTTYREQRFDETILQARLSLEPQEHGRRVNVAVVACFPTEGQVSWTEAENKLSSLTPHLSLEHHRVLLRPNAPTLLDNPFPVPEDMIKSQLESLRVLPWLLTRVVTGGLTYGEDEFFFHFSELMDVLFLAEREGGQVPEHLVNSFFKPQHQPHHVRLMGFSRLSLEPLLTDIATSLSQAILHRAYNRTYEDMRPAIRSFERRLAELIGEFLRGERTAIQVEDYLFDKKSLPFFSVASILREVPSILTGQAMRLQQEELAPAPPPSWLARLWQKILAWLGLAKPSSKSKPDKIQREYLINRLNRFSQVIQEIADKAGEAQEGLELPSDFIRDWSDELESLVLRSIKEQWQVRELTERLAIRITRDVKANFSQAIFNWGIHSERAEEVRRAMEIGNLLRFSAPLKGGMSVVPQAVVTSLHLGSSIRHGAHNVQCANLRHYPGRPPYLVAASEPVPIERILY